jgi:VIT1/CCC1 family predicted Fe2+/Mn2+ transporter
MNAENKTPAGRLLQFQRNEITEHHIYRSLARKLSPSENAKVLERIADEEKRHYEKLKGITGSDVKPDRAKILKYVMMSKLFGFTFAVKLMEAGEKDAQDGYGSLGDELELVKDIAREEDEHEDALVALLDEERLRYTGSIVLGLNDALVELTGALAGLTLALQKSRLIALTGAITGIAAAMSMAASEYLSIKSDKEDSDKNPIKASGYTGLAYISTVVILVAPYMLLENHYLCLGMALGSAVLIIALFNYYLAVAKNVSFRYRFLEMAGLSLGIAGLSFVIGFLLRQWMGVDV